MLGQLFNKKKELKGSDIDKLLSTLSVHREPVIVKTGTFKFVTDILSYDSRVFQLKNTLSRDEVLYQLKGKTLKVMLPYELTIFGGTSRLMGLGLIAGMHTLKLEAPSVLMQEESRGAYRVSRFPESASVTFTTDNFDIVKCRLADISMTGAGLRLDPRWEQGNNKLSPRTSIILDIKLTDDVRVSTTGTVRYLRNYKCGVQFAELGKGTRDKLFKFIVEQRREEQRALIRMQQNLAPPPELPRADAAEEPAPKPEAPKGKPTVLLVGDRQNHLDFLTTALTRKFDVIYSSPSVTDIRNQLSLNPNLCLIELKEENQEQVIQMRKVSSLLPPGCVLMFFGRTFTHTFRARFENWGYPNDILIPLHDAKKLLIFKQIDSFYQQRAPK